MAEAMSALPAGPAIDRRDVLLSGSLLLLAAGLVGLKPLRTQARITFDQLDAAIPKVVGNYQFSTVDGLILPEKDEASARLYDEVLTRQYIAPDLRPIGLLIAYGSAQDEGLQLHRPDECYPAQGFQIVNKHHVPMQLAGRTISAVALSATRFDRTEQLLYWTRIADAFPPEASDERRVIIRENLARRLPDGVLVRLSTTSGDAEMAQAQLQRFGRDLFAGLGAEGRRLLLGSAAG